MAGFFLLVPNLSQSWRKSLVRVSEDERCKGKSVIGREVGGVPKANMYLGNLFVTSRIRIKN